MDKCKRSSGQCTTLKRRAVQTVQMDKCVIDDIVEQNRRRSAGQHCRSLLVKCTLACEENESSALCIRIVHTHSENERRKQGVRE